MPTTLWFTALSISLLSLLVAEPESPFTSISPRPDWALTSPTPVESKLENTGGSVHYLQSDIQHHLEKDCWYKQLSFQILSETGVEDFSQLNFDFQPEYETLEFHEISLMRDGEVIDRLTDSNIQIIQREEGLNQQLYDGTKTAHIILEDVRKGDILTYAYSLIGNNPVFDDHHHHFISLGYSSTIEHARRLILWNPQNRRLKWKTFETATQPLHIEEKASLHKLSWTQKNLPRISPESNTPSWHIDYPFLEYSDYDGWSDFHDWAAHLFLRTDQLPQELIQICETLKSEANSDEELIVSTLRWVQRNIRYLGSFMGEHTHEPYSLDEIMQRRFGDCKDQGMITSAMLSHLGFDAVPALVNTSRAHTLTDYLPGHSCFNHLIVHLQWEDNDYYLDPTYTYQGGPLATLHHTNTDYAFVMREGEDALRKVQPRGVDVDQTTIEEEFTIHNNEGRTTLTVTTTASGGDANRMRREFSSDPLTEFSESYLEFYQSKYPGAAIKSELSYKDDLNTNTFTINELYEIPNIWVRDEIDGEPSNKRHVSFLAHLLDDKLSTPPDEERTTPYAISFPNQLQHFIDVHLPRDWEHTPVSENISHPSFQSSAKAHLENRHLRLEYRFKSLKRSVTPDNYHSYRENMAEVLDNNGYQIYLYDENENKNEEEAEPTVETTSTNLGKTLWYTGAALGGTTGLFSATLLFFFWNPKPRTPEATRPSGIGGWLILPVIGIVLFPFVTFHTALTYYEPLTVMEDFLQTEEQFFGWRLYYFSGSFIEFLTLSLSLLVAIFLFSKRTAFPYAYIGLLGFVLLSEIFFISYESTLEDIETDDSRATSIGRLITQLLIWGSYMMKSQRVKATFKKRRRQTKSTTPPPIPPQLNTSQ